MPSFLGLFFPTVAAAQKSTHHKEDSAFCTFNDFRLQLWTASMFLAGAFTGIFCIHRAAPHMKQL